MTADLTGEWTPQALVNLSRAVMNADPVPGSTLIPSHARLTTIREIAYSDRGATVWYQDRDEDGAWLDVITGRLTAVSWTEVEVGRRRVAYFSLGLDEGRWLHSLDPCDELWIAREATS